MASSSDSLALCMASLSSRVRPAFSSFTSKSQAGICNLVIQLQESHEKPLENKIKQNKKKGFTNPEVDVEQKLTSLPQLSASD